MNFNMSALNFMSAALCGASFLFASVLHGQHDLPQLPAAPAQPDSITLEEPLSVLDINRNPQLLVGIDGQQLRLAFPNMPGAEALVPVDSQGMMLNVELPENYNNILFDMQLGNYQSALTDLRTIAAPLSHFLMVSPAKTNFHSVFLRFYNAEVVAGEVEEAVELSLQMPWGSLSPEYVDLGEQLLYRTIEEDQVELSQKLLSLFYSDLTEEDFAGIAFRVADALRTKGEHELAGMVYGSLARSSDPVLQQKSLLWAGYSRAVAGDAAGAREIMNQVDELERGDENFLTYCLAQGRLGYADDNTRDGLRYLARAMVLTAVDATFKPELYYLLTVGYQKSGNTEAADRLAREFAIFYPDNPWLKKYQSESNSTL